MKTEFEFIFDDFDEYLINVRKDLVKHGLEVMHSTMLDTNMRLWKEFKTATKTRKDQIKCSIDHAFREQRGDKEYLTLQITFKGKDVNENRVTFFYHFGKQDMPEYITKPNLNNPDEPLFEVDTMEPTYIYPFSKELWEKISKFVSPNIAYYIKTRGDTAYWVKSEKEWLEAPFDRLETTARQAGRVQ